jgi:hypothetical protein
VRAQKADEEFPAQRESRHPQRLYPQRGCQLLQPRQGRGILLDIIHHYPQPWLLLLELVQKAFGSSAPWAACTGEHLDVHP